jgi:hypothetical protein
MVEVKNIEVYGLEKAVNAINNSFNVGEINTSTPISEDSKKWKTAESLGKNMDAHQSHDAYLKGILVSFDIKGNGVFMPEFQRYHFQEIVMSQSTMHSMEKFMTSNYDPFTKYVDYETKEHIKKLYKEWNTLKSRTPSSDMSKDEIDDMRLETYYAFERLVHNLPRGFELWATVTSNYLQLKSQVIQRAKHKNVEDWGNFVEFCYSLPRFRELCGFTDAKWDIENIFPLKSKIGD